MFLYKLATLLFLFAVSLHPAAYCSDVPELYVWQKQVLIYTYSYAGSGKVQTVTFLTPEFVGNVTWTIQQEITDNCPTYPMDVLISTQQGSVPWINESNWAPELLILKRQRFAFRLENREGRAISFDTVGTRQFFVSAISLSPEPSKVQRLGLARQPCDYSLHVTASGFVAPSLPLVVLDKQVTVNLPAGQILFFRLAVPQFAYSLSLFVVDCDVPDGNGATDCPFSATVSSGAAAFPPPLSSQRQQQRPSVNATMLFEGRLSPLSGVNYLSLVASSKPLRLTFTLSVRSSCRPPGQTTPGAACELFSVTQDYNFNGLMSVQPSSPDASGRGLRVSHVTPVAIPVSVGGLADSRRYLIIEVAADSGIYKLHFCLGRRLSVRLEPPDACEAVFSVREPGKVRKIVPRLPPGIWYLTIVNEMMERSEIKLNIYTSLCPNECSRGGRCRLDETGSIWTCSCYAGFAGELCEGRVPVTPDPLASQLLLCLSNVAFLPTATLATRRGLYVEALIYTMAMVSSGLYHACDNNNPAKLCVLKFDTLGKLDFLCAFLSLWVTVLVLVDLTPALKQLVQMAGALFLLVGVLVNRTSFITIAVPLGLGLSTLVLAWICRCRKSRRCHPPLRLVLTSLLPGGLLALTGFAMFALLDTQATYYLVHSAWHCCVALAILLMLPRDNVTFLPGRGCSVERCLVIKDSHAIVGSVGGADRNGGSASGVPLLASKRLGSGDISSEEEEQESDPFASERVLRHDAEQKG